jgi:predicted ATPase
MTPVDLSAATPEQPIRVGRYDVTGLIGAGGMGAVYAAVDRDHGTRVALKTLTHLDAQGLLRFKHEFRSVAGLSHPNLVSLYELSCHDDLWFFTMERVESVDFIAWLRDDAPHERQSLAESATTRDSMDKTCSPASVRHESREVMPSLPPSLPRLRDAFTQLVRGVRALHEAGLLHLDLKPSNVLVDREGRVVVVDFGLVRAIPAPHAGPAEPSNAPILGTPAWMAPEQHLGAGVGEPADWYAVGLMLYAALTGVPAFASLSSGAAWYAKRYYPPLPPEVILSGVPADLSELAAALLDPEPARRPAGHTLAAITAGEAPSAPRVGRQARSALVGREAERALLGDALRRVSAGGAAVVHLLGPSGVGKSALVASLLARARDRGEALALHGRCYARESVPYKAFDEMLDELSVRLAARADEDVLPVLPAWIAELARVFPVLAKVPAVAALIGDDAARPSSGAAAELRRRALEALRELFTRLAAQGPLVLAIDDLQWADADSAALLVKLVEAPAPRGLLLAVSLRPEEAAANPAVAAYLRAGRGLDQRADLHFASIDVGPLSREEAERLASATLAALGVPPEGLAAAIAGEAAGVPFFVQELARYAAQQREAGAAASTHGIALPLVLAGRVTALAGDERALVEVLAVADSPIPLALSVAVAGIDAGGVLRALWSLSLGHFVRSTGAGADDRVELCHDRMREAVLGAMTAERIDDLHLSLGRTLAARDAGADMGPWLFDAVRHLNGVAPRLEGAERTWAARLDLAAGRRAHRAAAFPLAFDCFLAGTRLLDASAWDTDYELALALHGGAAETAYLRAAWGELDAHVALVKARARTILDQLVAWEAQIDACIARNEYVPALDVALEALRLLDVDFPADPGEAEVGAELQRAMAALARVGPEGLAALPAADDPRVTAAMRIEARISSAAYFARPMLLPVIACRLVATSVERGLSPATPYALSIYGIVLNTLGMLREAHTWGSVALVLLDRFDDKSLEARTRHVVHDLVCTWTVPLASTLDDLRAVVSIGRQTGDVEYAAYAAHAYVHNAFYAARELEGLLDEALELGAFMRGFEQVNALHVHAPFEQLLRCFTGKARDPARLDTPGTFDEAGALEAARAAGSRSAQCIVRLLMGIVRYHFGSAAEASACLELARPFLDGVASTWHVPIFHQYAALAVHALPEAERRPLRALAEASLSALRALAEQGPENFAHRVSLVEAESARADGDLEGALPHYEAAIAGAEAGDWHNDLGLAHELASRCRAGLAEAAEAAEHLRAARAAYTRWGATAKVARP